MTLIETLDAEARMLEQRAESAMAEAPVVALSYAERAARLREGAKRLREAFDVVRFAEANPPVSVQERMHADAFNGGYLAALERINGGSPTEGTL